MEKCSNDHLSWMAVGVLMRRYAKIADSSKNYIITQYGISCFEQTGETHSSGALACHAGVGNRLLLTTTAASRAEDIEQLYEPCTRHMQHVLTLPCCVALSVVRCLLLVQVLTPMRLQPSTSLCSLNPMAPTAVGEQCPCSLSRLSSRTLFRSVLCCGVRLHAWLPALIEQQQAMPGSWTAFQHASGSRSN
jgi:hypothetical protein